MLSLLITLSLFTVDLGPLFEPPTPQEIQTVLDRWSFRIERHTPISVESYGVLSTGHFAAVISHMGESGKHYALLRYPKRYVQGWRFPVVMFMHGGTRGFFLQDLRVLDDLTPTSVLGDYFFIVAPSYPGELLDAGSLGSYESEGALSIIDTDVNDSMMLLRSLLLYHPDMAHQEVAIYGHSRGGAVALIQALRDENIARAVNTAGPVDWMLPYIREGLEAHYNQGAPIGVYLLLVKEIVVQDYVDGITSLQEARLALIKRSPVYFVELFKPTQSHHGKKDITVLVDHALSLESALQGTSVPHECFFYEDGTHNAGTFPGFGERLEAWLLSPWRKKP